MLRPRFIRPCLPSKTDRPPTGPQWVHEVKHDGYRLMVHRDSKRVRCFTRNGHNWADRFPAIVEAALRIRTATSFYIDGEAVILGEDGSSNFNALRTKRQGEAVLVAFDLLEDDHSNLRDLTLIERKARLKKLLGRADGRQAIRYVDHLTGDGPTIFAHVCQMGLEGIVSKRIDAPYRSGPSKTWLKSKNPASEAVRREPDEEWR